MQKLVFTNSNGNSIDLTSSPFGITNWKGLSNTQLSIQTQQVPFQDGSVFLDALLNDREIDLTVSMCDNNDLALRYELRRTMISVLNPKLGEGTLVYTNDYLSKQIKAIPEVPLFSNHNSNDSGTPKVSVTFNCCSPYWEDTEETVEVLNSGKVLNVYNEGDYETPCNIKLGGTRINNLVIKNLTTGKKIALSDSFSFQNYIEIETQVGKKSIQNGSELESNLKNINVTLYDSITVDDYTYFVGASGTILRTSDGINFELLNSGVSVILRKIIYAEDKNLFVCVGFGGTIVTSSDGETWSTISSIYSGTFIDVCYAKDKSLFIAITTNKTYYASSDGETWTSNTLPYSPLCIDYSSDLSLFILGTVNSIYTSSDGETWTAKATANGTFFQKILIVNSVIYIYQIVYAQFYYSSDGETWNIYAPPILNEVSGSDINFFYYDDYENRFIISLYVSSSKQNVIYTSSDCYNFSEIYSDDDFINTVSMINGYYICACENDLKKTTDFLTYYNIYSDLGFMYCSCKVHDYIIILSTDKFYKIKNDEITEIENPSNSKRFYSVCYSKDKELIVGVGSGGTIVTSSDGETWTVRQSNISKTLYDVCYVSYLQLFIAVGASGTIITSSDGITWTSNSSPTSSDLKAITVAEEKNTIVLATSSYIYSGYNLLTIEGFEPNIIGINSLCYDYTANMFVANGGYIAYSSDAKFWTATEIYMGTAYKVKYISELNIIIAVANDGKIYFSYDGKVWVQIISNSQLVFFDVSYNEDKIYIFGNYGSILTISYELENIIDSLTPDSNLNFVLAKGRNEIYITSDYNLANGSLTFRNKYIGV